MALEATYLEIAMPELVEHLLAATGQKPDEPTNPAAVLDYLKLQFMVVDLAALLPGQRKQPRGILSYHDRIVGVDKSLRDNGKRLRFTTMHEIGHYVLPNHQNDLYVCEEKDFRFDAQIEVEQEANEFAAELLFQGDRFTKQANDFELSAESIKTLAHHFDASFEATARRFAEKNSRPCGLVVFSPASGRELINTAKPARWRQSYTVASAEFRTRYTSSLKGEVPEQVVKYFKDGNKDFADTVEDEVTIGGVGNERHRMAVSYFTNQYSVFALVRPLDN